MFIEIKEITSKKQSRTSTRQIAVLKCDICKIIFERKIAEYKPEAQFHFCGKDCTNAACKTLLKSAKEKTCLEKYGVINVFQTEAVKAKLKETCLEKFGFENVSHSPEIAAKKIKNSLEKYGTEYPNQNEEIKKRIMDISLEKYGNVCSLKNPEIQAKSIATCQEKWGVDHAYQAKEVHDKIGEAMRAKIAIPGELEKMNNKRKETNLDKFGVEYPMQSAEVRQRRDQTSIDLYGNAVAMRVPEIKEKVKEYFQEKYGADHYLGSETFKNSMLETFGFENPSHSEDIKKKKHQTKKDNGTFNKPSKPEDKTYKILKDHFGENNVVRQLFVNGWDLDFYIPSLDGYVEENGVFYHGLNKSAEELLLSDKRLYKNIYGTYLRDKEKVAYFSSKNKPLAIITDQQINKLPPSEALQIILSQLTTKPSKS
jgi:hypothetical protein